MNIREIIKEIERLEEELTKKHDEICDKYTSINEKIDSDRYNEFEALNNSEDGKKLNELKGILKTKELGKCFEFEIWDIKDKHHGGTVRSIHIKDLKTGESMWVNLNELEQYLIGAIS